MTTKTGQASVEEDEMDQEHRGWDAIRQVAKVSRQRAIDLSRRSELPLPVKWDHRGPFMRDEDFKLWLEEETKRQTAAKFPERRIA